MNNEKLARVPKMIVKTEDLSYDETVKSILSERLIAAYIAQQVVPEYQLSLAIGKAGQNVRLAAKLTGWKIDVKSESAAAKLDSLQNKAEKEETEE